MNPLRIAAFNCKSVKHMLEEVQCLCDMHNIVCLQDHWLMPNDLHLLNSIHTDFSSVGYSAMTVNEDIVSGRPFGGKTILFRKCLVNFVKIIPSDDSRISIVKVVTDKCNFLLFSVYLTTEYGDSDSLENYIACCSFLESIITDSDVSQFCIAGDFNSDVGARFFNTINQFALDNNLIFADMNRLSNVISYCSDDGSKQSWIGHILCSTLLDADILSIYHTLITLYVLITTLCHLY